MLDTGRAIGPHAWEPRADIGHGPIPLEHRPDRLEASIHEPHGPDRRLIPQDDRRAVVEERCVDLLAPLEPISQAIRVGPSLPERGNLERLRVKRLGLQQGSPRQKLIQSGKRLEHLLNVRRHVDSELLKQGNHVGRARQGHRRCERSQAGRPQQDEVVHQPPRRRRPKELDRAASH